MEKTQAARVRGSMENKLSRKKQAFQEDDLHSQEYPVHDLGEAFFQLTTIEDADDYFFKGIHRHNFYELLWFTGAGADQAHFIDFNRCPIACNQLFLLLPGQVHSMEKQGKQGFLMAFSMEFFENLTGADVRRFLGYSSNFTIIVPDQSLKTLNMLVDLITLEYDGAKRPAILESYLRSWFLHCIELQKETTNVLSSDPRLQMLSEVIEMHYRRQRRADFYARQLSISAKRLNELTRGTLGKTVSQMLNDRLILEAKREIGDISKPIKEISYELGFSEPSYFTRFFGKQTGLAPQDFRKRISAPER